jgi:hypothetical protein
MRSHYIIFLRVECLFTFAALSWASSFLTLMNRCECFDGFGAPLEGVPVQPRDIAPDCSRRTCQVGAKIRAVPVNERQAHVVKAECSDNGVCNRATGVCQCAPGWGGTACDRLLCPDECSGKNTAVVV